MRVTEIFLCIPVLKKEFFYSFICCFIAVCDLFWWWPFWFVCLLSIFLHHLVRNLEKLIPYKTSEINQRATYSEESIPALPDSSDFNSLNEKRSSWKENNWTEEWAKASIWLSAAKQVQVRESWEESQHPESWLCFINPNPGPVAFAESSARETLRNQLCSHLTGKSALTDIVCEQTTLQKYNSPEWISPPSFCNGENRSSLTEDDINHWLQIPGCKEELPGRYRKATGCCPSSPPFCEIPRSPEAFPMPWTKTTSRSASFNPGLHICHMPGTRLRTMGGDGAVISMLWLGCLQTCQVIIKHGETRVVNAW